MVSVCSRLVAAVWPSLRGVVGLVDWSAGSGDRGRGRECSLSVGSVCSARSAGGGECFELVEGGEQLLGPRPVVLQAQLAASSVEREPGGNV